MFGSKAAPVCSPLAMVVVVIVVVIVVMVVARLHVDDVAPVAPAPR